MSTPPDPQPSFLRHEYRRARQTRLVWSAALALIATAMTGARQLGWMSYADHWIAAPAALSAGLLVWWLKRASQLTLVRYAGELDARWAMRSRLESAIELAADSSPLAQAQRADAITRFAGRENIGRLRWRAGATVVVFALGMLGIESGAWAIQSWREQHQPKMSATHTSAPPTARAAALTPEEQATIVWKNPPSEIKATSIEEVPLTAVVESPKGFRTLQLEVLLNGQRRFARVLEVGAAGESAQAGSHEVTPSVFIDETGAKPFDIVSYHLTGELIDGTPGKVVSSPLQFIQIRTPERLVARHVRANPDAIRLLSMLSTLKLGQVQLAEANFALARIDGANDDPAWQTENGRAAHDQAALSKSAAAARSFALTKQAPLLVPTNLTKAINSMDEAVDAMTSGNNRDAVEPQGRALSLITECEKAFIKALELEGDIPAVPNMDPFREDQVFNLEARGDTPAGHLENLASRQRAIAEQLRKNKHGMGGPGGGLADQKQIATDAKRLSTDGQLDGEAGKLAGAGAGAASSAAMQIDASDLDAAREPAAAALVALEQAVDAQERAGRAIAVAELVRVRADLNAASRVTNADDRGGRLLRVRDDLRAAAVQQQRTGSAEAARLLAALADALGTTKSAGPSAAANSPERAHDVAVSAARLQTLLAPRAAAINRAVRLLKAAENTAGVGAGQPGRWSDVELASQEAEWLTDQEPTQALAREVAANVASLQRTGAAPEDQALRQTTEGAARLAVALETARLVGKRDEVVRRFNVEDIDPAYRSAVEAYFERLSRDGAETKPVTPLP